MPTMSPSVPSQDNYDPRWFIWTIVFLLVSGVSLVSYIMLSDSGDEISPPVVVRQNRSPAQPR